VAGIGRSPRSDPTTRRAAPPLGSRPTSTDPVTRSSRSPGHRSGLRRSAGGRGPSCSALAPNDPAPSKGDLHAIGPPRRRRGDRAPDVAVGPSSPRPSQPRSPSSPSDGVRGSTSGCSGMGSPSNTSPKRVKTHERSLTLCRNGFRTMSRRRVPAGTRTSGHDAPGARRR